MRKETQMVVMGEEDIEEKSKIEYEKGKKYIARLIFSPQGKRIFDLFQPLPIFSCLFQYSSISISL